MRVDLDVGTLDSFQNRVQIAQVMAGDQDRLAGNGRGAHVGRLRDAEGAGVGGIQHAHHLEVQSSQCQSFVQEHTDIGWIAREQVQRMRDARAHFFARLAEDVGMVRIGGHTL